MQIVHKFEAAGLGKAPFRFVSCEEKTYQACPGAPVQPGGSCDYCGTGIRFLFWCKSADGKRFKVGCDCIRKVSDGAVTKLLKDAERAERKLKKDAKRAKLADRLTAVRAKLDANPTLFTDRPHPAIVGKTGRDYIEWMLRNAGDAGRARVAKMVEAT